MRPADIKREILDVIALVEEIYSTFGLPYRLELSTRPEKSIGTDEDWEIATEWTSKMRLTSGDDHTASTKATALFTGQKSTSTSAMLSADHGNAERSSSIWRFRKNSNWNIWIGMVS